MGEEGLIEGAIVLPTVQQEGKHLTGLEPYE